MSRLIATIISGLSRPHFPFILLESSLVQSCLPVLRAFVDNRDATTYVVLFCLLYPPSAFVDGPPREGLDIVDRTTRVPGYSEPPSDLAESILNSATHIAPDAPLTVIIDAADVLCADLESPSKSYSLIATLLSDLSARPSEPLGLLHTFMPVCSIFLPQSPHVSSYTSLHPPHSVISSSPRASLPL